MGNHKKRLSKKIISGSVLAEIFCMLFMFAIAWFFILPRLYDEQLNTDRAVLNEIVSQIETDMQNAADSSLMIAYSEDLRNTLNRYRANPTDQYFHQVQISLHSLVAMSDTIRACVLEDGSGHRFSSFSGIGEQDILHLPDTVLPSQRYYSEIYRNEADSSYSYVYSYKHPANQSYTFHFLVKASSFLSTARNLIGRQCSGFTFQDMTCSRFMSDGDCDFEADDITTLLDSISSPVKTEHGYILTGPLSNYRWYLTVYVSDTVLFSGVSSDFFLILMFCFLFSLVVMVLIIIIANHFIRPVNVLNDSMKEVASGNLDARSHIASGDEIEDLSHMFNTMLDSIQKQTEETLSSFNREQRMKYNLLTAQIDSHFIYNTMTIINSLARRGMNEQVIEANTALLKILRNCLRVKTLEITDTLKTEVDVLEQYLVIERFRYRSSFQVIYDIPQECLDLQIPKNILQPIVENSLMHGLMDKDSGVISGTVWISCKAADTALELSISDSGAGASEERMRELKQMASCTSDDLSNEREKHFGLSNINKRLLYIYNGTAYMDFKNENGFHVILHLPITDHVEITTDDHH